LSHLKLYKARLKPTSGFSTTINIYQTCSLDPPLLSALFKRQLSPLDPQSSILNHQVLIQIQASPLRRQLSNDTSLVSIPTMCYVVVERYSACGCVYYVHSVDMCSLYSTPGHEPEERTVYVGYACPDHNPSSYQAHTHTSHNRGIQSSR